MITLRPLLLNFVMKNLFTWRYFATSIASYMVKEIYKILVIIKQDNVKS